MTSYVVRKIKEPEDYTYIAPLFNIILSEPTTAEQLREDEERIPPGELDYNEDGKLTGWDRPKWVVEDEQNRIIAYSLVWRAPWTEPGELVVILVVHPEIRGKGAGAVLYDTVLQWAREVRASRLLVTVKETDSSSIAFAERRGYTLERHAFESVLELDNFDGGSLNESIRGAEASGITFSTLAEEPGEESERKLYELYKLTHTDIPGFSGSYPWFEEWKKWNIDMPELRPEWFHIAKDGDRYVGVVTLKQNEETRAMYHEYTGVLPEYRGRRIALALKMLAIQTAQACGVPYLKTHNDSMNAPMLRINRDLIGFRAEPGYYQMVCQL